MAGPPLDGFRILAVSQFGAGPYGTMLLADMGAEVIKIEDPTTGGDVARYVPPYAIDADSLYFQSFNRGKKSIGIDFRQPTGMSVFRDLARVSHGVYNNLRGDLPSRLGLDYESLRDVNPAVVTCSLSGFGATGPRASEPGYDPIIQALAGYMSVTGEPNSPPAKCGVSVIDFAGGFASALGLVAGLLDASRSGVGRDVDVSLLDTGISMLSYFATWHLNREWEPTRAKGSAHQTLVPSQNFRTSDGWVTIFCAKEVFWQRLAAGMELSELREDARFATFVDRHAHRNELIPLLERRFAERSTRDWLDRLQGQVPIAPINTVAEALVDEQVAARDMVMTVDHPEYGLVREVASPIKTGGEVAEAAPAPALGQDTDAILANVLGYDSARIASLRDSGAVC